MDEQFQIPEESKKELIDAALKLADFIHKNRIRSVFCIEGSARLPGRLVLEVYSRRFPRDVPPNFFFVAPASLSFGRYDKSQTPEAYEKALRAESEKAQMHDRPSVFLRTRPPILSAIKGRAPIMILDDVIAGGVTLRKQHSLFRKIRGTNKGIFVGALYKSARTEIPWLKGREVIGAFGGSPFYRHALLAGFARAPGKVFSEPIPAHSAASAVRREISELVRNANITPVVTRRLKTAPRITGPGPLTQSGLFSRIRARMRPP